LPFVALSIRWAIATACTSATSPATRIWFFRAAARLFSFTVASGTDTQGVETLAYGSKAKQALSGKVFGKTVRVVSEGHDLYGRTLGTIEVDGKNVNLEMVREGCLYR